LQLERRLCVGYARDTHATDLTHAAAALRALQTKVGYAWGYNTLAFHVASASAPPSPNGSATLLPL
jgi:hypothetical protein